MVGFTGVLVFATWGAAPLVAYDAMSQGARRSLRGFLSVFAPYSAAVLAIALAVGGGFGAEMPLILPWIGTSVVSVALFLIARKGPGA